MKKNIVIISISLLTTALVAFGFVVEPQAPKTSEPITNTLTNEEVAFLIMGSDAPTFPNFFYDVSPRFMQTVTLEKLKEARSIADFVDQCKEVVTYTSVELVVLDDANETALTAIGSDDVLTPEQLALLSSLDYSTNFKVRVFYTETIPSTNLHGDYMTPHLTVVPEKQATYEGGKHELITYLKNNSQNVTAIEYADYNPGKLYFTVNAMGQISDVSLTSSCGYPEVDAHMQRLIRQLPGRWIPAENAQGERVSQKLVFSFGNGGC